MTGPEHFTEAERLTATDEESLEGPTAGNIALAQVHATLALAAATAMNGYGEDGSRVQDFRAWDDVCGVQS